MGEVGRNGNAGQPLTDLDGFDLPRLGLPHGVTDFRKLRPVCREIVEPAYQNDDPQSVPPGRVLKLEIPVQSHEYVEMWSRCLHEPAVGE